MKTYPILMADMMNSRKRNSNQLISEFKHLIAAINKKWKKQILSPLTITLGDEFQGLIDTPENAIKIIFDLEEEIIKNTYDIKLRYVLNEGEIETAINNKIAYGMLGKGLTEARAKLHRLKNTKHRFQFSMNGATLKQDIINDLFIIYENYVDNWKHIEYHIVKEFIMNKSYQEVAEVLDINVSSAWRRLKSLNIEEYFISKNSILKLYQVLNEFNSINETLHLLGSKANADRLYESINQMKTSK